MLHFFPKLCIAHSTMFVNKTPWNKFLEMVVIFPMVRLLHFLHTYCSGYFSADVICKHGTGAEVGVAEKSWKFVRKVVNYFISQGVTTRLQLINRFVYEPLTDVEYLTNFILSKCDDRE